MTGEELIRRIKEGGLESHEIKLRKWYADDSILFKLRSIEDIEHKNKIVVIGIEEE